MSQARNFILTDHKHDDLDHLKSIKGLKYMYAQRESCPSTGKQHWQGFLIFNSPKRLTTMFKQAKGAHIERMNGTPSQNMDYCSKRESAVLDSDGNHTIIEHGDKPDFSIKQGQRTDLTDIQEMILQGSTIEDVADDHFAHWCRYDRSFSKYALMKQKKRDFKTNVYYYVGPSGTGKSRLAAAAAKNPYYKNTGKWWDGYDGTSDIIIDDFTGNIPFTELLRITDRYPHQVESKGGMTNFAPKNIYITSNMDWKQLYCDHLIQNYSHIAALERRITQIIIFDDSTYGVQKKILQQKEILQQETCLQESNGLCEEKSGS